MAFTEARYPGCLQQEGLSPSATPSRPLPLASDVFPWSPPTQTLTLTPLPLTPSHPSGPRAQAVPTHTHLGPAEAGWSPHSSPRPCPGRSCELLHTWGDARVGVTESQPQPWQHSSHSVHLPVCPPDPPLPMGTALQGAGVQHAAAIAKRKPAGLPSLREHCGRGGCSRVRGSRPHSIWPPTCTSTLHPTQPHQAPWPLPGTLTPPAPHTSPHTPRTPRPPTLLGSSLRV